MRVTATVFRGRYTVLRPIRVEDAELTLRWRLDERAVLLNRGASTVAEQAAWIASRPSTEFNFVIELASGKPVGMLSLTNVDQANRRAEPGRFLIGEPEAVRGFPVAVEAMKLLYEFAFDGLKLHRVHGTVVAENRLMLKWQRYLGMSDEGVLRQHYLIGGTYRDAICLAMLEDEFRSRALPRMNALIGAAHSTIHDEGTHAVQQ
jgi:RimJ/RimL family protein N-acetyltransferase